MRIDKELIKPLEGYKIRILNDKKQILSLRNKHVWQKDKFIHSDYNGYVGKKIVYPKNGSSLVREFGGNFGNIDEEKSQYKNPKTGKSWIRERVAGTVKVFLGHVNNGLFVIEKEFERNNHSTSIFDCKMTKNLKEKFLHSNKD